MTANIDRDQIIFTITLLTNYSEGYLKTLSNDKLVDLYNRVMEK